MGIKSDYIQNNFTNGEISPTAQGRFDINKYANSLKTCENFLLKQLGGAVYRPGTVYAAETKASSARSRLLKFQFSTDQVYVIEAGNLYFRFYTNNGQLQDGGSPVELVTVFETANLTKIKYAQNADTMYIATGAYPVQKLTRLSATSFQIEEVAFKRGPFLDTNITNTTITPSADTGNNITLTASSAIFTSDHVGSLWRVKDGVVKIDGFNSTTEVTGDVQDEPDGTSGNLGTGVAAVTDWAEGSWSAERGYPSAVTFHEGRLYFANTTNQVGGVWGSVPFAYENFDAGNADDDDAINIEINSDTVSAIRWLSSSPKSLQAGTTGGIFSISSGTNLQPITPTNVNAPREHIFGTADIQGQRLWNFVYYVQNDLIRFLESGYQFDIDAADAIDTTLLADHILQNRPDGPKFTRNDASDGGAYEIAAQQSPNNRIWVVRDDGQMIVLTRNVRQEVNGWARIIAGGTNECDELSGYGLFESVVVIQREGLTDQVWTIVNRYIGNTTKRFVEYFSEEDFKHPWQPVRLDSSLSLDSPLTITDVEINTDAETVQITTSTAHGLSDGDEIRLDNIVGTHQLNGTVWTILSTGTFTFVLDERVT